MISGKIDKVFDLLKKGLQMSRDIHGLEYVHPNVANTLSELGRLYVQQGRFEEYF